MNDKNDKNRFSPFSRWSQFNLEHTERIIWLQLKHPSAAAVLSFLVDQMDVTNALVCSYRVLEDALGLSRATASRCVKILRENGFIFVRRTGRSNIYAIDDRIFWKSYGHNRKYSKFPANVVIALSEQDEECQLSFNLPKIEREFDKTITLKPKRDFAAKRSE